MNFLQRNPFFRLLLALIVGIVLHQYYQLSYNILLLLAGIAALFIGIGTIIRNSASQFRFRWLFGLGTLLALFTFGHYLCKINDYCSRFESLNTTGTFVATVSSPTVEKPKSYRCEIKLKQVLHNQQWKSTNGNAVLYLQKSEAAKKLLIGDELVVRTEFKSPPGAENPDAFNYANYLNLNGIRATAYLDSVSWHKTAHVPAFSILRLANQVRSYLIAIYAQYGIKDLEFAVLAALTVGYTDDLSPDLRSSYSATGAMHILSVSGLHVGIVYAVIAFALGFLKQNRFQIISKTVLIVLILWSYAFVTGLSPSVIRSALMFSFIAVGTSFNRKSQIFNTIFMSAFLILLYNPNFIYNIGFQLSYSAVLSILIFHPPLVKLFPTQNKPLKFLRDLILVSLAAQVGTVPFTLYYFQQFPNYFILTNLVAIPLSTFVIYGAIALLITSAIPTVASIVAYVLNFLLIALNFCIVQIHHLPHSTSIIALSFTQMTLLTFVIACTTLYFYTKKANLISWSLAAMLSIIVLSAHTIYTTKNTNQLIVYASAKHTHINFIAKGKNYLYSSQPSEALYLAKSYWHKNHIDTAQNAIFQPWFINNYTYFADKRIIIANEKMWKLKSNNLRLNADILIIGDKLKPKIDKLLENYAPNLIVVDKTISTWYTEKIRNTCQQKNIKFYSVAEKGAFILTATE
ncbi:MAG: ComEC family competence protein [Paludibacter sp.]|nr:ComEC family competence protein [Paludibacter sp.]